VLHAQKGRKGGEEKKRGWGQGHVKSKGEELLGGEKDKRK
jgi:hypothetical protein